MPPPTRDPVPAVSVLLPVRDAAPWLPAALASLGRQSRRDFEVIAVDDGSTDGSGEILERRAEEDPRLRVLHRPPRGLVAALNHGLVHCRAPLVARMDADDVAHAHRLELQLELLERRPEIGVASCRVRLFPCPRVSPDMAAYEEWLNGLLEPEDLARERFVESPLPHPSVVVRRELLEDAGGWRDGPFPEDYDLWLRLAARGVAFAKVDRVLLFWREHEGRATRTDPRYRLRRFLECKAEHLATGPAAPLRRPDGTARSPILWGAGWTGKRLGKALAEHGAPPAAWIDVDPAKEGRTIRGARVHRPDELPPLLAELGPEAVVLAAVSARGAREAIRERLIGLGLVEGEGFWCVA